jgi:hypothetical protein
MHAEVIRGITIRPLRKGEREVVRSVFDRLGPRSRLLRFGGAKTALSAADLDALTLVDADHHVLVALVGTTPIGIARLVRDGADAEIAFAVVDEWQQRGVGSIERLRATMHADNRSSLALMRRVTSELTTRIAAGQLEVCGRAAR